MGLGDFLNNVVNHIPVVGQVKAAVHLHRGDAEGAEKAFMSATRSMGVLGAAVVAGPVGALVVAVTDATGHVIYFIEGFAVGFRMIYKFNKFINSFLMKDEDED